jgi:hypothetical protein
MKLTVLIAIVVTAASLGAQPAASGQASSDSGAKRVRANRQGFDLDPKSAGQAGPQMGAGSRGGERSTMVLYAPNLGLTYSLQPLFQWKPEGSGKLTFQLFDADDNEVFESDVTGQSSFPYPQEAPALKPGETYRWTVQSKAIGMSEPPPSAHVRVVSGEERQKLEQQLSKIAGQGKEHGEQRAQLFADNRLWYDAVGAYTQLIAENPTDAKLYQERAAIYSSLPQTKELAAQDMAKAGK